MTKEVTMQHIKNAFADFAKERRKNLAEDEYVNENDGLIYCKKCKNPRECIYEHDGTKNFFYTPCKCRSDENERQRALEEKLERERRINELRLACIRVPSYRGFTFDIDDGKTTETTAIGKNYVKNFKELRKTGQGLLFYGGVGTGKTFLAMCIANALIDAGYCAQHTSLAAVVQLAQNFDNADTHFVRLMRKDCIILDDLGTERATSFSEEQIYKHIDGWNVHSVPLIITTNNTLKEIEAAAADTSDLTHARIYSRILEKCYPVRVNDYQRRAANTTDSRQVTAALLGIKPKN
jgi:DNA replication protein DnaC